MYTYRIDEADRIIEISDEWLAFANANNAENLAAPTLIGTLLWDHFSNPNVSNLFRELVEKVRKENRTFSIPFRCDSPVRQRNMQLEISGNPDKSVSFISRTLSSAPTPYHALLDSNIERSSEFVIICSWCKKIEIRDGEWIDIHEAHTLLNEPKLPDLSHAICPNCRADLRRQLTPPEKPLS